MAHPFAEHRQHVVEKERAHHISKGHKHRASGGKVRHDDEAEDRALFSKMIKEHDREMEGHKGKHRRDRVKRAHGGKVGKKGKGATHVNVIVGGQHANPPAAPMMPPMGAAPAGPPPVPPGGMGAPAPGAGPMLPPGLPPRAKGGRIEAPEHDATTYRAKGGKVKSGPAWEEGLKHGTQVSHRKAKAIDIENMDRPKPITYAKGGKACRARGGRIESDYKVDKATRLPGGGGGGAGRLSKIGKYGYGKPMHEVDGAD